MKKIIDFVQELSIVLCIIVMIGLVGGFERSCSTLLDFITYLMIATLILVIDLLVYVVRKH